MILDHGRETARDDGNNGMERDESQDTSVYGSTTMTSHTALEDAEEQVDHLLRRRIPAMSLSAPTARRALLFDVMVWIGFPMMHPRAGDDRVDPGPGWDSRDPRLGRQWWSATSSCSAMSAFSLLGARSRMNSG